MKIADFPSDQQVVTTISTLLSRCFSVRVDNVIERIDDTMSFLLYHSLIREFSITEPRGWRSWEKLQDYTITVLVRRKLGKTDEFQMRLLKSEGGYNTEVVHKIL